MNKISTKTIYIIAAIILLLSVIRIFLHAKPVTVDDPFITFRYAYNISHGNGFVFNEGVRWLGTTTPFYALMLSFWVLFTDNIPAIAKWIGIFSYIGTVFIIFWWLKELGNPFVGLLAGFTMISFPLFNRLYGFETHLYIFLIFLSFYLLHKKRLFLLSVVSAILLLTRPDAIALIGVLFLYYLITQRRIPLYSILIFLVIIGIWSIFGILYFASPVPRTVFAKVAQGQSPLWQETFGEILINNVLQHPLVPVLALFGIISCFFIHLSLIPLVLWFFAYILGFSIAKVPAVYGWYYAPLIPALFIFAFLDITDRIKQLLRIRQSRIGRYVVYAIFIAFVMLLTYKSVKSYMLFNPNTYDLRYQGYKEISEWINHNVEKDEIVAASEVGILGYSCPEVEFVDFCGLITPTVAVKIQTLPPDKFGNWFMEEFQPDYILLFDNEYLNNSGIDPDSESFTERYKKIKTFKKSADRWKWHMYDRRW